MKKTFRLIALATVVFFSGIAFAAPTTVLPAGSEQRVFAKTTIEGISQNKLLEIIQCQAAPEECPPTTIEYLKSYGKAHGGNHTGAAKAAGAYTMCTQCHNVNETDAAITLEYSFCPSSEAVQFANPAILTALGLPQLVMLGEQLPLATGGYFRDEILNQDIICGGNNGCFKKGEVPLCLHCHHHDGSPEDVALSSRSVHNGCLDCHVRVGSGSVKEDIKDKLEGIIGD